MKYSLILIILFGLCEKLNAQILKDRNDSIYDPVLTTSDVENRSYNLTIHEIFIQHHHSIELNPKHIRMLDSLACFLLLHPSFSISIRCYEFNKPRYSFHSAIIKADKIKKHLIFKGIANKVEVIGIALDHISIDDPIINSSNITLFVP